MSPRIFLPGFALRSAMYSRLEAAAGATCIDITPLDTWDKTIDDIAENTQRGSLAVGYSLGGRVALGIALAHPGLFSGLVLISSHAGLANKNERDIRAVKDEQQAGDALEDREKLFEYFDKNELFDTLDSSTKKFWNESRDEETSTIAQQLRVLGLAQMPFYEDRLGELRIPVLYITGTRDDKYTTLAARYKKLTPFSHHRILDADHRVPLVAPKTLSLYIEWFANNVL